MPIKLNSSLRLDLSKDTSNPNPILKFGVTNYNEHQNISLAELMILKELDLELGGMITRYVRACKGYIPNTLELVEHHL